MDSRLLAIWNMLHDGGIENISGQLPGDLQVCVALEYLRELFEDDGGDQIIVKLANCTMFSHRLYDVEDADTDFEAIADRCPGILSAEMDGPTCRVYTDIGILDLQCKGIELALDSGRAISLEELKSVAERSTRERKSDSSSDD